MVERTLLNGSGRVQGTGPDTEFLLNSRDHHDHRHEQLPVEGKELSLFWGGLEGDFRVGGGQQDSVSPGVDEKGNYPPQAWFST